MKPTILTVLFVTLIPIHLEAGPGGGKKGIRHVMEQLDLSDQQKEQIKEIRKGAKEQRKILRQAVRNAHQVLDQALESNNDDGTIRSAFSELETKKGAISRFRFEHMMKIRSILTPDQRSEFQRLRPKGKRRGKHDHNE